MNAAGPISQRIAALLSSILVDNAYLLCLSASCGTFSSADLQKVIASLCYRVRERKDEGMGLEEEKEGRDEGMRKRGSGKEE